MPRRLVPAVVLPVALALTVTGCGSSGAPGGGIAAPGAGAAAPAASAAQVLQAAYTKTSAARTARVLVTIRSAGGGLSALDSDISGVVDFAGHSGRFTTKLLGKGTTEIRIVRGSSYVHLPAAVTGKLSTLKPWLRTSTTSTGASGDPTRILGFLQAAGSVRTVGTDTVRGTSTTHYRGTVDVSKLAAASGSASAAATVKKFYGSTGVPVDIWVDDAGRARRIRSTYPAPRIGGTPGATKGTISTSTDVYDFGVPVDVQAPPQDQVSTTNLPGATGG